MRVLQINSVCGIKSTGKICTDLAEILVERGYECRIAYGREHVPEKYQKYAIRIGNEWGVKFNAFRTRLFDNEGRNAKLATKKLIKTIEQYDPEVIHLHNLHGYYINIELLFEYLKTANKKVVWTLHDCWAFTGHCAHFSLVGCEKWQMSCYSCPQNKVYPKSYFDHSKTMYNLKRDCFTGVKDLTIVAPSQWLADLVKKSFLKNYPVKVIHNGVDLSNFSPTESFFREKYDLQNKKLILGVASAWGYTKGLEDFIELSKVIGDEYKIVMVGINEKQKKIIPQQILALGITHSPKELAQIYTAADIFVNPTREEVLGLVNIEALACGTPIITFNTGGCPEIIDETCGLVVEQKDVGGLMKKIGEFNSHNFSKSACLTRAKNFEKKQQYLKYIELYES